MAYYEKKSEYTYRLIVCNGYDSNGKKIRKRKTIKLAEHLTQKQIEKELNRQLVLFEKEVLTGNYLDGEQITFAEFTERWLKDYGEVNLAPATLTSYKNKLDSRILPAIGHIKIAKLQPIHLLQLYQNLNDTKIRLDGKYYPTALLLEFVKSLTAKKIEKDTGISFKTCQRIIHGKDTTYTVAENFCNYYELKMNKMFKYESKEKLSEKTIRGHIGVIRSILSTAVKWNIINDNLAKRIDMKKAPKTKAKYYDDEQIGMMLNKLRNEPIMYIAMIYLTLDTGMRKSELAGLKWEDVNFEKSTININKQRHYVTGYGTIEDTTKTDAGVRTVTISQTVLRLLRAYKNVQNENKLKLGTAWVNEPYVFVHENGMAINPNLPYKWFTTFLSKNNLPKITFHQLRHTNASLLISSGEDIVTVSSRLGHADKNITLNTYSHVIKSKEAQVANKMDEFYSQLKVSV